MCSQKVCFWRNVPFSCATWDQLTCQAFQFLFFISLFNQLGLMSKWCLNTGVVFLCYVLYLNPVFFYSPDIIWYTFFLLEISSLRRLKSRRTHSADVADCKTCHMWQVVRQTLPKPKANMGFSLSQWRTKHCMLRRWPTNVPDAGSVCGCQWWDCARHKLVGCLSFKIMEALSRSETNQLLVSTRHQ